MDVNHLEPDPRCGRVGRRVLVVNSQFDTLGSPAAVSGTEPPQLPFTVSDVPLPGGRRGTH